MNIAFTALVATQLVSPRIAHVSTIPHLQLKIDRPFHLPWDLPGPQWPLPSKRAILPGPRKPDVPITWSTSGSVPKADEIRRPKALSALKRLCDRATEEEGRVVFDAVRPSKNIPLPEQSIRMPTSPL